jgi:hypothetical protein
MALVDVKDCSAAASIEPTDPALLARSHEILRKRR